METRGRFNKEEVRLDSIETHYSNIRATMKSFKVQRRQLASSINAQQKGSYPSDIEKNPKEHCKAITLRNGKEVEGPKV